MRSKANFVYLLYTVMILHINIKMVRPRTALAKACGSADAARPLTRLPCRLAACPPTLCSTRTPRTRRPRRRLATTR